jgi:hypothetical protein
MNVCKSFLRLTFFNILEIEFAVYDIHTNFVKKITLLAYIINFTNFKAKRGRTGSKNEKYIL